MTTPFNTGRDVAGNPAFAPPPSDTKYSALLTTGVQQSITLPRDASSYKVGFSFQSGSDIWVAYNQNAVVPTGSFALTNSEYNPSVRSLLAGTVINFITNNTTATVCVVIYADGPNNTMV